MLQRYMEALDESEGLQAITARLCERLGVGEALPINICKRLRSCIFHIVIFHDSRV